LPGRFAGHVGFTFSEEAFRRRIDESEAKLAIQADVCFLKGV
jgi:hypothetical protein